MQADIFLKRRRNFSLIFLLLIAFTYLSMYITEFQIVKGLTSFTKAVQWAFSNFFPDAKAMEKLPDILDKLLETVLISISSTTIAAIFATFFALCGSKSTKINGLLSTISRGIATISRNIPVAAWAMILLFSFGQSSITGFFALFFASFGFLTRSFMETIDEVSNSSVEALRATGAQYFPIIFQSVIPSSLPQMISWVLFEIETNIRSATLVGILTGTGIGFSFDLYYKSSNYSAASLVVIVIVLTVFVIEYLSNSIRRVIL
ncbi:phosphonate ABC transporter, permease protein PhnE [Bacillus alveayuensis]|jgi:phosphonate transport system permease protein|uniref:Phosphonate transport system permease protein n=1 Tax=Aeribacillus alveayuensis TaxID=279215 RepID=A0ABT9VRM7_9BACI|nr:phosphonate ABC transporter, permease protein PhnE [Bacillus alveayuensis]MDQ0163631.1 phosphonate transport system permease protein [Bacillus alveayuensis]